MSTYLLALANGEFAHLQSSYKSPLSGKVRPLRIYGMPFIASVLISLLYSPATPDVISQAQYALDVKQKVLPLYEQVFDVEYALPKLDTLVVNDFDIGAMENWVILSAFLGPRKTGLMDVCAPRIGFDHRADHCFPCRFRQCRSCSGETHCRNDVS
jgi:hypothetical protein